MSSQNSDLTRHPDGSDATVSAAPSAAQRSACSTARSRMTRAASAPTLGYAYLLGPLMNGESSVNGSRGSGYLVPGVDGGTFSERIAELDPSAAPDLIVVDLVMPAMTGWEFIERMRRRKGYRDVPVIVISGSTPGPVVMRQIHKFIAKPFLIETLEETVIRLFSLDLPPKCEVIDLHPVQRQAS